MGRNRVPTERDGAPDAPLFPVGKKGEERNWSVGRDAESDKKGQRLGGGAPIRYRIRKIKNS